MILAAINTLMFYRFVLKHFKKNPELLSPIQADKLEKYKSLFELLESIILPHLTNEKEAAVALSAPMTGIFFFSTEAFYNLIQHKLEDAEILSRDEIERREGDRERQIRRLKRDTARFGGIGSFAVVEEEILSSGRRRLKRKRSTSPTGRGTPRGATSRADSPSMVDVSVAKATSLTETFVPLFLTTYLLI